MRQPAKLLYAVARIVSFAQITRSYFYLTLNFETFLLNCIFQILYAGSLDEELIIPVKNFPHYRNTHPLRRDGRQTTE